MEIVQDFGIGDSLSTPSINPINSERVLFFLDYANIDRAATDHSFQLDYGNLLQYVGEYRTMLNAYCYIPIDPRNEHRLNGLMEALWESGYIVRSKLGAISGNSYRCNLDVEMSMDILKSAYQLKPNVVVIASGDGDFLPIVNELRQLGIRVEVASFRDNTAREMILKSSGFIDLGIYYQEYFSQANQNFLPEEPVEEETLEEEMNLKEVSYEPAV